MLPRSHPSTRRYTSGSFIPLGGNGLDTPLWSLFKEVGCLSPAIRDPRALQETSLQGCFWQSACLLSAVKHPWLHAFFFQVFFHWHTLAWVHHWHDFLFSLTTLHSSIRLDEEYQNPRHASRESSLTVSHSEQPFAWKFRLTLAGSDWFFGHRCAHFHSSPVNNEFQTNRSILFWTSRWPRLDFPNFRHFIWFHGFCFLLFLSFLGSDDPAPADPLHRTLNCRSCIGPTKGHIGPLTFVVAARSQFACLSSLRDHKNCDLAAIQNLSSLRDHNIAIAWSLWDRNIGIDCCNFLSSLRDHNFGQRYEKSITQTSSIFMGTFGYIMVYIWLGLHKNTRFWVVFDQNIFFHFIYSRFPCFFRHVF